MTRTLPRLLSSIGFMAVAFGPCQAWAVTESYCNFPTNLTAFTFNGNAFEADNSVIRLTNSGVLSEASSAFITNPITLSATTPLHAYFTFSMGPSATGGDGVAFVLQNSTAMAAALGGTSGNMGYSGIKPSVVIEFDTFKNGSNDPNANNVSILLNGSSTTHAKSATPSFTMAGSPMLYAWIDYSPTGTTLSVYLAQTATKPAAALLTYTSTNLATALSGQAFIGFTSATGSTAAESNEHDIYELELSTAGTPCACEGDSACSGATPACSAAGICALCSATNASGCPAATPVCDVPLVTCVGCLTNANCSSPHPICDATALTCRACMSSADCGGTTPHCATTGVNSGDCVLCVANTDCPQSTPRCSATNTCVQCLSNNDCGGDTPVCKAGTCKPCASDADCSGATPACEVWGACGQCTEKNTTACSGDAGAGVCDNPTGTCVACEFNSDCSGTSPTCNTATHMCRPCAVNADCSGNPGGPSCMTTGMKAGSCVVCAVDSDCTSSAAPHCDVVANQCVACQQNADCAAPTPVCNSSNICVGCLTSADCSGATPVCDPTSSRCVACENDYAATNPGPDSCPVAAMPACQPPGAPLAGQCALCSSLNDSACATIAATPVCITSSATCGCVKDTDCNTDSYCDTSTTATGVCTPGCRVVGDAGVTNCATGKYCAKPDGTPLTDGTLGTCTSEPCNSNSDCKTSANPVCNTRVQPTVCVQCNNDPDCPTGEVCDSMNHCVECTSSQTKNCAPTGKGAACLASESCGCATDADCGSATSARVCDPTQHTCTTGCRASGGNGCPFPETCSATDGGAIGQCQSPGAASSASSSGTGGTGGGASGNGGSSGTSGALRVVTQSVGCGCRVAGNENEEESPGALAVLLASVVLGFRSRRRTPRAR